MGLLIDIKKVGESNEEAFYFFWTPEGDEGKVSINKNNGDIKVIEEPTKDIHQSLTTRVGAKLRQHWKNGEFPEVTMWAS